jgi:hypothetical protein
MNKIMRRVQGDRSRKGVNSEQKMVMLRSKSRSSRNRSRSNSMNKSMRRVQGATEAGTE